MKASELMIGDWVCCDGDTDYECPLKVDGISGNDVSVEGEGFLGGIENCIVPIPLTEAMLKANGLRIADYPMGDTYVYYDNRNRRPLYIRIGKEQDLDAECVHDDAYLVFECEFVHELQHALRLCGFKELADNFKV